MTAERPVARTGRGGPVFIMAPCQRSGTNWLAHILTDCGPFTMADPARLPGEDWLLEHAGHLIRYCTRTVGEWRNKWQPWTQDAARSAEAALALAEELGRGILRHVAGPNEQARLLFHTPSVRNIVLGGHLFPDAQIVAIVRDGRDVVDSATSSWPSTTAEAWAKRWAAGVAELVRAVAADTGGRILMLKYEDLYENPRQALDRVESHLRLCPGSIDLQKVSQLPVFGSSRLDGGGDWSWSVERRSSGFRPIGKWKTWPQEKLRAVEAIAGGELRALGYA